MTSFVLSGVDIISPRAAVVTIYERVVPRVEYDAYRSELEGSGGNPPELLLARIDRQRRHCELELLYDNRVCRWGGRGEKSPLSSYIKSCYHET